MQPNPLEAAAWRPYRLLIRGVMRIVTERSFGEAEQAFRDALLEEDGFLVSRAISSARICLAYALLVRGRMADALEVLVPALAEAEEDGLAGQLVRNNPIVIRLLRFAHGRGVRRQFCEQVLGLLNVPLHAVGPLTRKRFQRVNSKSFV